MISLFKNIWRTAKEVHLTSLDTNLFLIKFETWEDKRRVLNGSPWSFDKWLFMMQDYDAQLRPKDYKFLAAPFWIRLYDLPFGWLQKDMAIGLAKKVGKVICLDMNNKDKGWSKFKRVRVEMDVRKLLSRIIMLGKNADGSGPWGRIKDERLPNFCYECGVIGHVQAECQHTVRKEKQGEIGRKD